MRVGDIMNKDPSAGGTTRPTAKSGEPASGQAAATSTSATGVTVRLGAVASAVTGSSTVPDNKRVEHILARIQSGQYKIDFERLADRVLDEEMLRGRRPK